MLKLQQDENLTARLITDLSFALRTLRRNPGFASICILTFALAISANAALYSVVRAVLLRSHGYADPERLVQIAGANKAGQANGVSIPDLLAFQSRGRSFAGIGTYRVQTFTLIGPHEPENIYGDLVSADFFSVLGVTPLLGRPFGVRDFQPGAPSIVLIAHSLWTTVFDGDPGIVGRRIILNGSESTVVGVMRPEFEFPLPAFRIWSPMQFTAADLTNHGLHSYTLVARLRAGVRPETAQAELIGLSQSLAAEFPNTNMGWRATIQPLNENIYGGLRPMLLTLLGAVGFVLLIACMNVSNLLMARGVERSREMALRAALGATRGRLILQLFTESLLIAGAGAALGLLVARGWLRLLQALLPARTFSILPGAEQATLDFRVLAACVLVTVVAGLFFGALPAFRFSSTNLEEALKEAARSNTRGLGRKRFFTGLIIAETGLSVTLLIGAGLLIRSFQEKSNAPLGFRPEQVLTVQIPSEWTGLTQRNDPATIARRKQYFSDIVASVQSLRGVTAAAITTVLPLGSVAINTRIFIQGRAEPRPGEAITVAYRGITPDYFRAMGIPLVRGRAFTPEDREGTPLVVIVNDAAARLYWPAEDPIGKQITLNNPRSGPWATVVGVAKGVRWEGVTKEPLPELYTCFQQVLLAPQVSTVVLRSNRDSKELGLDVRSTIHAINPNQPLTEIRTMNSVVSQSISQSGLFTVVLACFAGLALLLAAAGIFSVIAWTVSQSTHEIGIRMSLGATPRRILQAAMERALTGVAIGLVSGLAGAGLLNKFLASQLYGVTATDPLTFLFTSFLLMLVSWMAAYLPARRATRVDPMLALRSD
jgi:putative ABC transport system permease protein